MKFSIDKNILLNNLQFLVKATPSRSTLPIIGCVFFNYNNNKLKLRTTDLELSIDMWTNIEGGEPGSIAVPINKLLEITNAMPQGNINFAVNEIGKVSIKSKVGYYTIMGQKSEEFPPEQQIENPLNFEIKGKELKNIINNTTYATSKDDLKPVLQGVLFQINKNGFVSVATDGHRLVKYSKSNINNLNYSGSVVVPYKFLTLLSTQLENEEKVLIAIADNHIQTGISKGKITSRIIKDPYPDYEGVIPKDNNQILIVNKQEFLEAIKRVSIFSNKANKQIALNVSESNIQITTEDPESITSGKEEVECNYNGEPMTIGYNASYLIEVVQHQQTEEIKILLKTPLNAGLFLPFEPKEEDEDKTTLLMPIRLND